MSSYFNNFICINTYVDWNIWRPGCRYVYKYEDTITISREIPMSVSDIIDLVQNLGAPVVYSLLALWFIKFQFVKAEDAATRGREERQRIIDDFTARDAANDKRAFDLAEKSNEAISSMKAALEANTKSMDALVALITKAK